MSFVLPEGSLHDCWVSPVCFLSVTCMFLKCHLYVSWVSPVCLLCTDPNSVIQIYNKPSTTELYWFLQNNATSYKSTQIRTDLHRFWQIHTYLFVWTQIHKYTHRFNTKSWNFVKIHTDPYKSTQDSYRSIPIPTDQLRFEQINTYSFTLHYIHKDTLILTQNHVSPRIAHNQTDP